MTLVVALTACDDRGEPRAEPVAAPAPERAAATRAEPEVVLVPPDEPEVVLPPARLDPTLRFARPDWTVDQEGDLRRPVPWIPDAPELDALIPDGTLTRMAESWELVSADGGHVYGRDAATHILHRVQLTVVSPALPEVIGRLQRGTGALSVTPRSGPLPVLTWLDPGLAAEEVRIVEGPRSSIAIWGDTYDGRALLVETDEKPDGRTLELVLGVMTPRPGRESDPLARFISGRPELRPLAPLLRVAGPLDSVEYRRVVGRPPRLELGGSRPISEREAAAVAAVLASVGGADAIERDTARLARIQEPRLAAWTTAVTGALRRAGFRRLAEPDAYHRALHFWFDLLDDTWLLGIGSER